MQKAIQDCASCDMPMSCAAQRKAGLEVQCPYGIDLSAGEELFSEVCGLNPATQGDMEIKK